MKAKSFLLTLFVFFCACIVGYFILADRAISKNRIIPKSYKQFLIESSFDYPRNKIVLVGGSDVHHGINAIMIEQAFNQPVINLGDNGGYPLEHKIYNILNYVNQGDVVIFSLGWTFYSETRDLRQNYIEAISDNTGAYSFFYETLPILKRFEFVFRDLPFSRLVNMLQNDASPNELIKYQYEDVNEITRKIKSQDSDTRGSKIDNLKKQGKWMVHGESCDSYLFKRNLILSMRNNLLNSNIRQLSEKKRREISSASHVSGKGILPYIREIEDRGGKVNLEKSKVSKHFINTMAMVDKLREKGVKIYFTWAITTDFDDSECYQSRQTIGLKRYAKKIRKTVEERGYQFLGEPNDSHFDSNCYFDTYAHIIADCAEIRTNKLIDELSKHHNKPDSEYNSIGFDRHLVNKLTRRRVSLNDDMETYAASTLKVLPSEGAHANNLSDNIFLTAGWHEQENWGVWSDGYSSAITLKIENNHIPRKLILKGRYLTSNAKTGVYINGQKIGDYILENTEIQIPEGLINDDIVYIRFDHKSPVTPKEINPTSNDTRLLEFGLIYINLI